MGQAGLEPTFAPLDEQRLILLNERGKEGIFCGVRATAVRILFHA